MPVDAGAAGACGGCRAGDSDRHAGDPKDHVKLVAWPASSPVAGLHHHRERRQSRADRLRRAERAADRDQARQARRAPGCRRRSPGMRAISVKVNEVIGVAGFVVPGTHVDVMVTLKRETDGSQHDPGRRERRPGADGGHPLRPGTRDEPKPIPTTVVTLLVTPEDAERVDARGRRRRDHAHAAQPGRPGTDRRRAGIRRGRCSEAGAAPAASPPAAVVPAPIVIEPRRRARRAAPVPGLHRRGDPGREALRRAFVDELFGLRRP